MVLGYHIVFLGFFYGFIFLSLNLGVRIEIIFLYLSSVIWYHLFFFFLSSSREVANEFLLDILYCLTFVMTAYIFLVTWHDMHNLVRYGRDFPTALSSSYLFISNYLADFVFMGNAQHAGFNSTADNLSLHDLEENITFPRRTIGFRTKRRRMLMKLMGHSHYHDPDHVLRHFFFYEHRQRLLLGWETYLYWFKRKHKPHYLIFYRGLYLSVWPRGIVHKPGALEYFRKIDTDSTKMLKLFEEECQNLPLFVKRYTLHSRSWEELSLMRTYYPNGLKAKDLAPSDFKIIKN
jgi:hypothetical protein